MDHLAVISRFVPVREKRQGMAFREVLVTQVKEVLRAWLAGQGKRPAARRAGVDVKTAQRYIAAAQEAGLARDGGDAQLTDELLGQVVAAVRPSRPAGHGASWEALAGRKEDVAGWVKGGLTLVKVSELLERSGTVVPYRTLARFAAEECGYSSSSRREAGQCRGGLEELLRDGPAEQAAGDAEQVVEAAGSLPWPGGEEFFQKGRGQVAEPGVPLGGEP
jgi:hypothetical protein